MMPFWALYKYNAWSKVRGETKQEELIGMSTGREDASAVLSSTLCTYWRTEGRSEI
eukprot:SAG22_NODE_3383_length_1744_cov_2.390881_3_plen_56_part_00